MPLTRMPHWATREFNAHLKDHARTPFAWGTHDCCTSAANAIQSYTGVDIASDFRSQYDDLHSAHAAIARITGVTPAEATIEAAVAWCAARHGLVEWQHPLCAQRGDLVLIAVRNADAERLLAGVVHLNGLHVVTVSENGFVRLPLSTIRRAWKV